MSKLLILFLFVLSLKSVWGNNSTCGSGKPTIPDCDHPDFGSCGNACCGLDVNLNLPAADVYESVKAFLVKGGSDGSFEYVTGPDSAGHNPGDDLQQYGFAWQFIFQGHHKTTSGYVDPLDFNIKNGSNSESCILRLFSISGIHGALGDAGQNFKSLAFLLNEVFPGSSETIYYGCGGN
jgi:hypothetical protein